MKPVTIALAALLTLPSAAIACSCVASDDPAELREFAEDAARGAVALVEVDAVRGYQDSKGIGEDVKVVRTLAGSAPATFHVVRRQFASSASCDDLIEPGQPKIVILYPATKASGAGPAYRVSSLCTNLLLSKPVFRDTIISKLSPGERG